MWEFKFRMAQCVPDFSWHQITNGWHLTFNLPPFFLVKGFLFIGIVLARIIPDLNFFCLSLISCSACTVLGRELRNSLWL